MYSELSEEGRLRILIATKTVLPDKVIANPAILNL
jgi:hypothetical protein